MASSTGPTAAAAAAAAAGVDEGTITLSEVRPPLLFEPAKRSVVVVWLVDILSSDWRVPLSVLQTPLTVCRLLTGWKVGALREIVNYRRRTPRLNVPFCVVGSAGL